MNSIFSMASDKLKGTLGYLFTVFKKILNFLQTLEVISLLSGWFWVLTEYLNRPSSGDLTFRLHISVQQTVVFCYNGVLFNTQWLHQNIRCSDTLFSNLTQKSISCFMFALEFPKSITLSQLKKISWIKHLENFVLKCPEFVTECSQRKMDSSQNCFVSILVQCDLQLTHHEH